MRGKGTLGVTDVVFDGRDSTEGTVAAQGKAPLRGLQPKGPRG